jgi:hypothetical protein
VRCARAAHDDGEAVDLCTWPVVTDGIRELSRSSPWRPEVGGSEAKNARASWPTRRDAKRLDSDRARLEHMGASFAKRSTLTRPLMSACSFGKMSVANVERGTSEGMPSRDRAIFSLFYRASATQPTRATVGRCGETIGKAVVMWGSDSARA